MTKNFSVDRAAYLRAIWYRRLGKRYATLFVFYALLSAVMGYLDGVEHGLIWGGILAIILALMVGSHYLSVKRKVFNPKYAGTCIPRTMEFSHEKVSVHSSSGGNSSTPWTTFISAERSGRLVFLFFNPTLHFIIDLDAFASNADRAAFESMVSARMKIVPVPVF